jgi:hypothetical protein
LSCLLSSSLLFSCLVFSSLLFSSLVFTCLHLSCLVLSSLLSISIFEQFMSLSPRLSLPPCSLLICAMLCYVVTIIPTIPKPMLYPCSIHAP